MMIEWSPLSLISERCFRLDSFMSRNEISCNSEKDPTMNSIQVLCQSSDLFFAKSTYGDAQHQITYSSR